MQLLADNPPPNKSINFNRNWRHVRVLALRALTQMGPQINWLQSIRTHFNVQRHDNNL